jgi:peptidoglycan/LPS O-acetylase OafA/YrhL
MTHQKTYFKNLDAIRFIAAAMVILQHAISPSFEYLPKDTFIYKILMLCCDGGLGVSIFFILSGFLITYLLIEEFEITGKIALGKFYMRRVLRIWPLYYMVLLIVFSYPFIKQLLHTDNPLASNIYYHLSFLSNFDVMHNKQLGLENLAGSQSINWSVSVEEQFYLLWPLVFAFSPRKVWGYNMIALLIFSITFRLINYTDTFILYFHTCAVLVDLVLGALLAYLIHQFIYVKTFFQSTSTYSHSVLLLSIFVLVYFYYDIFDFKYGLALGRLFISFFIACFIAAQAMTQSESFMNLKNLSFASSWGKYTYGIYLIHPIIITAISVIVKLLQIPEDSFMSRLFIGIVICLITLIISRLSYKYFEMPFLRLKDRFGFLSVSDNNIMYREYRNPV